MQYKHDLLEDADSAMVVVMSELVQLQETEMAVLLAQILVKVQTTNLAVGLQLYRFYCVIVVLG